jgi:hypothetical protein
MNIPALVIATSGIYRLTAHDQCQEGYRAIEAERIDQGAMSGADRHECAAILDLYEDEVGGNC